MKRVLAFILTIAVCLSLFGTMTVANADVTATKKFEDIDGHWAKADIEKMAKKGVINGVSDTEFAPDVNISRSEFLALVVRAMGAQSANYANAYADINGSEWYAGTVQAGKNLGLIDTNMTPGNEFKPTEPINREEMTSLIIRAYESKAKVAAKGEDISVFADGGEISPWAKRYVEGAYGLGIIKGVNENTFSPKSTATRAQAATIINRFLSDSKIGKTIRILSFGNSFSVDSLQWFYDLAVSYGYDNITLGILYISACDLEKHADNIANRSFVYTYKKNTDGKWVDNKEYSAAHAMKDEEWDYVVIGQSTANSGREQTYDPYLKQITDYIKANATNPKVKIAFNMTWSHQATSTHYSFPKFYENDQMIMYNSIVSAVKSRATANNGIQIVIPCGTAIQNARTSFVGDTLTRDGYHLSEYLGRYIAALTWFNALTGTSIEDVTYVPNTSIIPENAKAVAIESVVNAMKKPYAVTNSKITKE